MHIQSNILRTCLIAAALAALSMVPICFTAAEQPDPPKAQPLALVEQFATAPAATVGAVSRADARPPPRGSRRPYLRQ